MTPCREPAGHVDADDVGRQEVDRLAEHPGFGLDAAHAPADDPEAVDHRRVRVGSDERVGITDALFLEDPLREVLQVDLVDDADARRDDVETAERLHAPLEELVARAVALELHLHVEPEGVACWPEIDLDRVVDDEVDRNERLDEAGSLPIRCDGRAHRREVHEQRDAGEVLQHDAGDDERDLFCPLGVRLPAGQGADVAPP